MYDETNGSDSSRLESLLLDNAQFNIDDYTEAPATLDIDYSLRNLFGTLEVEGLGQLYCFVQQRKTTTTWYLTTRDIFEKAKDDGKENYNKIIAILKSTVSNALSGYGKTHILTRLLSDISAMIYKCSTSQGGIVATRFITTGHYEDENIELGGYIDFSSGIGGGYYNKIEMVYDGFKLKLDSYKQSSLPFAKPTLERVPSTTDKSAIVANLGVKTAAYLFKSMGDRLNWYNRKKYVLIKTKQQFQSLMLDFLRAVQIAYKKKVAVLVGLDTETTGLHMLHLSPSNPLRDVIVAIPFAWIDDISYLICTDMFYFSNVEMEEVSTLFTKLFSRNADYSSQHIELDYCGEHFSFSRSNINVGGHNVGFDERAFFTHDCDVYFDDDGMQLVYNLATDWSKGKKSLKKQSRIMFGDETLELDELYGAAHKDKFKYLTDETLACLYGCADADYTRKEIKKARGMTDPKLYAQYKKYDMTLIYRTARAAWEGMPIDDIAVKKQGDLIVKDLDSIKEFIYKYAYVANTNMQHDQYNKLCGLLGVDANHTMEDASKEHAYRYTFTPANHKKLLYNILGYPVYSYSDKTHEPALDSYVLNKLSKQQLTSPTNVLRQDLASVSDPENPLIKASDFNIDKYPLARVFIKYSTLFKEYSSYYRPLYENDMEGRAFYDFSCATAATRRILSPGQTMKGALKHLCIAPKHKLYLTWDASQIEYRHMASKAYQRTKSIYQTVYPEDWETRIQSTAVYKTFTRMQIEESDYHIETSAQINNIKQHKVTPKLRKSAKKVGFGIPYGLSEYSLCDDIYGNHSDENMAKTKALMSDYCAKQKEIIDLLESTRDEAFVPAKISDEFREYLGIGDTHVGIVRNFAGFYRMFVLENLTRKRTGSIRRQAGNQLIQSGAAEIYRRMLYNFYQGCVKANVNEKVQWLMLVHDELDALVDDDIDVLMLIEILYIECTLRYKDHIPYYIGIGFGHNWADAKGDAAELPVIMVQRMIEAYHAGTLVIPGDSRQSENLLALKRHYMCDRVEEELKTIIPNLNAEHIWTQEEADILDEKFENYIVRAYLAVFTRKETAKQYADKGGVPLLIALEEWQLAREQYGFGVKFTTTKFIDAREAIKSSNLTQTGKLNKLSLADDADDIDLDALDFDPSEDLADMDLTSATLKLEDLHIDLFDKTSEELEHEIKRTSTQFDERSMFDTSADMSTQVYEFEEMVSVCEGEFEAGGVSFSQNKSPTSAFDIFVSSSYIRKHILNVKPGMDTVILTNTPYANAVKDIASLLKKTINKGTDTMLVIGSTTSRIEDIDLSDADNLDTLDKYLGRTQEENIALANSVPDKEGNQ